MNLVWSIIAALSALVALEVWLPSPAQVDDLPAPVTQPDQVAQPAATGRDVDGILQRPLFAESRRPSVPRSTPMAAAGVDAMPRLSGIMIAGSDRRAIFEGSDKPAVAGVGGQVGGYRIMAIGPRQVTLQGPSGSQTISLTSDPNHPMVSAPAGPSIIDRLNSQAAAPAAMPPAANLQEMLARLPQRPQR